MKSRIGKVVEVFLPNDDIESKQIGFKVMLSDELLEILVIQDENSSRIFKDDVVIINKHNFSNKALWDIELYNGEDYENN